MTPQLPLVREARAGRQVAEEHEGLVVALGEGREDEGPAGGEGRAALGAQAHADRPGERPGAGLGVAPGELAVPGDAAQDDGGGSGVVVLGMLRCDSTIAESSGPARSGMSKKLRAAGASCGRPIERTMISVPMLATCSSPKDMWTRILCTGVFGSGFASV